MDIQIIGLLNNISSKVDSYKSKLSNSDIADFSEYLDNNYDEIDKNKNGLLGKDEVRAHVAKNKNPEIQKIIDNKSIESIMANLDVNNDGVLSKSELKQDSNADNAAKTSFDNVKLLTRSSSNLGRVAGNLAQKLCQQYNVNASLTKLAVSAVNYVL